MFSPPKLMQLQWPRATRLMMLQMRLMKAVMIIVLAWIWKPSWWRMSCTLKVASTTSQMTRPQMKTMLMSAPRTSVRRNPKDFFSVGAFIARCMDMILMKNPATSESICAASVMMAIELESHPPMNSNIMKAKQMKVTR